MWPSPMEECVEIRGKTHPPDLRGLSWITTSPEPHSKLGRVKHYNGARRRTRSTCGRYFHPPVGTCSGGGPSEQSGLDS